MNYQLPLEKPIYKSCAITGHRGLPSDFDRERVKAALRALMADGVESFYNGLAMGFDLLTAELILELKKEYPNVKLYGCVPFYGQENLFTENDKKNYQKIISQCDEVAILSDRYYKGVYFKRNDYMIEKADVLFAYCKAEKGGAAYTVRTFARKKGFENIVFVE